MGKKTKKVLSILAVLMVLIGFLYLELMILRWGFNDKVFRHGDLNYWLLTNDEIRDFPIVGAKPSDVTYKRKVMDGTSPAGMILVYTSKKDFNYLFEFYKNYSSESNYSIVDVVKVKLNKKHYIDLKGENKYSDIRISIKYEKDKNVVRAEFVE